MGGSAMEMVMAMMVVLIPSLCCAASRRNVVIDVKGAPESVVWAVQLSDLHFSVHHPQRATDFSNLVGPALSMINPSLVLITGDLTDGKSKDLLTMKQNEDEWAEYQSVMNNVIERSGLDKSAFYDLRGNHDNFGVPVVGGAFDFFSKYSINGQLGRAGNLNSVTLQTGDQKHLFVGVDTTMSVGVRGPTNLFGHPTDQLLSDLDMELSQWDSQSKEPITKIAFGHFPLSFSATSHSGKSLKDIFLNQSISAYICGHLHARFGKNLKRHHQSSHVFPFLPEFFQLNVHQLSSDPPVNCSTDAPPANEFWEWEMGDWRRSRAMRVLAIDRGHVSYVDLDFKLGTKKTIILPTFPLDSRLMSTSSSSHEYECHARGLVYFEAIRALVFSVSPLVSVTAKIYDTRPGYLSLVLEGPMIKLEHNTSRGDLYIARWNYRAFEDPSPDRYWLQIEANDFMGRSTLSDLRPFSVNGLSTKLSWTWKEFMVMGCQWAALYYPMLWSAVYFLLLILLIPKAFLMFPNKHFAYKNKGLLNILVWVLQELCRVALSWYGLLGYVFYLVLFPWFIGQVFTDGKDKGYMTCMGWVVQSFNEDGKHEYVGSPDVMVVVLPHLLFVVFPAIIVSGALAAEKQIYREHVLSLSGKKEDDPDQEGNRSLMYGYGGSRKSNSCVGDRWIRKVLLVICFAICGKHFMTCRVLMKAYEMNPIINFPGYSLTIPIILAYTVYRTRRSV
ncbi:putative metallophosphoesterase At3g03305 isoform X2 [Argentina anserina]|uniref:putative metallophosphoesterase At3g03305 isoform X2 n=1 Tax=Argentina anserina TaxID=57926 RepID=UPI00217671CA|nr:putative metallophosphoesterase At3g03305 isoform X2 [Potentilla anserina]